MSQMIGEALPNEFVYTDGDLRDTLGPEDEETLDEVLDWARNGYTYTDANLRDDLAGEGGDTSTVETLDRVLDWTRNGFTYTDADLREDLVAEDGDTSNLETLDQVLEWTRNGFTFTDADLRDTLGTEGEDAMELILEFTCEFNETPPEGLTFDCLRGCLGLGRSLWFLLLLVPGVLLVGIGFLGGRRWPSRVMWAAVPMVLGAAIAYAAFEPIYIGVEGVHCQIGDRRLRLGAGQSRSPLPYYWCVRCGTGHPVAHHLSTGGTWAGSAWPRRGRAGGTCAGRRPCPDRARAGRARSGSRRAGGARAGGRVREGRGRPARGRVWPGRV